jgi:hypothetical protein
MAEPLPIESAQDKLLPCPFCGAKPHQGLTKVEHCQLHGEPFQRFEVKCPHTCARIVRPDRAAAIAAWNTRPSPTEAQSVSGEMVEHIATLQRWLDNTPDYDGDDPRASLYRGNRETLTAVIAALRHPASVVERDGVEAENKRLREALKHGAAWFDEYADQHQAKAAAMEPLGRCTPERDNRLDKAARNRKRAQHLRAALSGQPTTEGDEA